MGGEFIAIEGNIGAGKTSLAKKLSSELGCRLMLEQFEDNSFLPKFYGDPERYSFPLELSFLAERYQQLKGIPSRSALFGEYLVADYFIQKCLIFARANLPEDEFRLYREFFYMASAGVELPGKLVFLYVDTPRLLNNIANRGRDYEQSIGADYLNKINEGYMQFFRQAELVGQTSMLILDINRLDFVKYPDHYEMIRDAILRDYPPGVHRIEPGDTLTK